MKLLLSILLLLAPNAAIAAEPLQTLEVAFATNGQVYWVSGNIRDNLETGDRVPANGLLETADGRAILRLPDGSEMRLDERTRLRLDTLSWKPEKKTLAGKLETLAGSVMFWIDHAVDKINRLTVQVGQATAGVRGTSFLAELDEELNARLSTHSGRIGVGDTLVAAGSGLLADKDGRLTQVELPPAPAVKLSDSRVQVPFELTWTEVAGIGRYRAMLSRDADLADVVFLAEVDGDTTVRFDLLPSGEYYVVVQSIDALGFASIPPAQPLRIRVVQ